MSSSIQTLPTDVINLMAAGEVIDSLAAVVRELAENALDAGATRITIDLWTEQWRVRLADNGAGMSLADLRQAALSHSTNKIYASNDLWQINSLGFRGEALHSLAQLATLEICSRQAGATEGWKLQYTLQGEPAQVETVAIAPGTVVTVSNLFSNWLPRRQGLPPLMQQLRAIQLTVQQLALCHPQVTWQVRQNDRDWFAVWAGAAAKAILPQLVRDIQPSDLQDVHYNGDAALGFPRLYLLLGLPDRCHRRRPDWVKVAVNGRIVRVPELEQLVLTAFRRKLPRDRYPVCFIHFTVPPEQVDWNRHPAKAEIYLQQIEELRQAANQTIEQALQLSTAYLADSVYTTRVGQLIKVAEAEAGYGERQIEPAAEREENETERLDSSAVDAETAEFLTPLKAVAQVHEMYVLAEHPTGVWLIEQHIAHERVLYEQLCDRWQIISIDPPVILNQLSSAQIEQLQRIGVTVEPFGEQLWAARSAPESLAKRHDCADALLELSRGGDLETALVATACRTAIRNGTALSLAEMQTLLDQWQRTRNPRTCPHGRPIYLSLEESSLSRFFRRHWVIGKSHGI
ncbi:MAG: DNA mismatch repair endonuclease MutL [Elainellaceae cyanobacterium]